VEADGFEVPTQAAAEAAGRHRRLVEHPAEDLVAEFAGEGRSVGQHLVEDGAQRPDVSGSAGLLAPPGRLLGGHVLRRAQDGAAGGQRGFRLIVTACQAEIGDVRHAVGGDEDVRRLEVAVPDAALVGVLDGVGDGGDHPGRSLGGNRPLMLLDPLGEGDARAVGRDDVGDAVGHARLEDGDDVGVIEASGKAALPLEAGRIGPGEGDLEGHVAMQPGVEGEVDDAAVAVADLAADLEAAQAGGDGCVFRSESAAQEAQGGGGLCCLGGRRRRQGIPGRQRLVACCQEEVGGR
jgi:hypothetical protein